MTQNKKTKVLIFSLAYFPFYGGAEVAVREITKRIPEIHFDLIGLKFVKESPNSERIENVHVWRLGKGSKLDKYLYPWRAFLFARKLHKKNNYDLVWSMMASWAGMVALAFKIFNPKVKYLLTLQSGDSDLFIWLRTWFWYPIYRMIYTKADHIQVISRWLAKRAKRYGYKKEVSVIPNGVDLEKFRNKKLETRNKELRQGLGIPENSKIIFTSSRLVKKNDIKTLIRAFKILVSNFSVSSFLLIAGTGDLENELKSLVKELKLDEHVIFLGHLQHDELIKYYSVADVFARASLSEGQGISFIEAMAAGVPVVATPVGGILDFILDRKTGLFCKIKNPQDLAEKIKLFLEDKKLYQEIQRNGLELVKQKYDWNLIARKMEKIIKYLLE